MTSLKSIAIALGGEIIGAQVVAPGPGHSRKDRSLSVTLSVTSPTGFVVFSHCGDDWKLCSDYVCGRLGIPTFAPDRKGGPRLAYKRPEPPVVDDTETQRIKAATRIWDAAIDPRGTLAEQYLKSRRLELGDDIAGRVIRFHPSCPFGEGERHPCMVALMRNIITDAPQAIQRTKLPHEGPGPERKMLGVAGGAAIKIDCDESVTQGLCIGEGLETCLTARQEDDYRPVWALGSAGAIETFPVLSGIDGLHLFAENDVNGANARAIDRCGQRWYDAKREVIVIVPKTGNDLNDALRELRR